MAKILGLPKLSPTMEEGVLARWAKKEGDSFDVDELLAEVETDKATMEFRSFDKGVLLKILASEGATLAPDQPVAIIGQKGEDISALVAQASATQPTTQSAPLSTPDPQTQPAVKPQAPAAAASQSAPLASTVSAPVSAPILARSGRVLASPLVRKVARDKNIDLSRIAGSGPRGRIVRRDLDGAASGGFSSGGIGASWLPAPSQERLVPASQMRKVIARRLTESKQQVPHFYLTIDVDADPIWNLRQEINAHLEAQGIKVSVNDLVVRAVALALRKVPTANASWEDGQQHYHGRIDVSVAVAIADGLVTPVVRNADTKNVVSISIEVRELAKRARDKKLKPEEMQNGTFSVSNLGMYGIESFSAVINPPEGAILAVGSVREEPVVKQGAIVPGRRMRMTLSCDHRIIDGAVGAEYLAALRDLIEKPSALLL